jgi:hypothetical protein
LSASRIGNNDVSWLKDLVYPSQLPPGLDAARLPGLYIERLLDYEIDHQKCRRLESKLTHSCRKISMMCIAAERAKAAEEEFYMATIREAPVLFGDDAIEVAYHLESFIFFARSSLDVSSVIFGEFLLNKHYDSFNDLSKAILKMSSKLKALSDHISTLRKDDYSWFSVLCGTERGRALRDKVAHQTGFPIDYEELTLDSEKENAVVRLSETVTRPLDEFLDSVRNGVVGNFIKFEDEVMKRQDGLAP